jgi:hypothetical protein
MQTSSNAPSAMAAAMRMVAPQLGERGAAAARDVAAVRDLFGRQDAGNVSGEPRAVLLPGLGVGPGDPQAMHAVVRKDADEATGDHVRARSLWEPLKIWRDYCRSATTMRAESCYSKNRFVP